MRSHTKKFEWLAGVACLAAVYGCTQAQYYTETPSYGQYPPYVQYPAGLPPVTPWVDGAQAALNADQLDQLLGPVALYPDPLLSMVFPAATYPQDIAAAEQLLQVTPNLTEADINAQPWDQSVKGLLHYPTVLKMMSDQLDWTSALGAAFLNQQEDVMASVQRLRAAAQAAQNLQTTAQEQVLADGDAIRIEPVNPDIIYVPQYDPILVYSNPCPINFGIGFSLGLWCDNDFDWNRRCVVVGGGWFNEWRHPDDWDRRRRDWDHHADDWRPDSRAWQRAPLRPAPRLTPQVIARTGLDHPRPSPARTNGRGTASETNGRGTAGGTNGRGTPAAGRASPGPGRGAPAASATPPTANPPTANPPSRIGNPPANQPPKNVFVPPANRSQVEQDRQRGRSGSAGAPGRPVRPVPQPPAAQPRTPVTNRPQPAPVQRSVVPAQPAPRVITDAARTATPPSAPRVVTPPAPRTLAPPAPRVVAPAPRQATPPRISAPAPRVQPQAPRVAVPAAPAPPQNAFRGSSRGGQTRVESNRGRSSTHR